MSIRNSFKSKTWAILGLFGILVLLGVMLNGKMNHSKIAEASSPPPTYTLTMEEPVVTGGGTTDPSTPGTYPYTSGDSVIVEATPDTGYHFYTWRRDINTSANPITVLMDSNKSLEGRFVENTLDKIEYESSPGVWSVVPDPLYVYKGTTVNFRAVELSSPTGDNFIAGKPTWSGTSGASGTGATKSVTFGTLSISTAPIDYKTVIATQITESGTTIVETANVTVYELEGVFTPADNFSGRSLEAFGIEEIVTLSVLSDPIGVAVGTTWSHNGAGSLTGLIFDSEESQDTATFNLTVTSGVSQGMGASYVKSVIEPTDVELTLYSETINGQEVTSDPKHFKDYQSAGLTFYYWLKPRTVSFKNILVSEGFFDGSGTGILSPAISGVSDDHTEGGEFPVLGGDIGTGCKMDAHDHAYTAYGSDVTPNAAGTLLWDIPFDYLTFSGGPRTTFATIRQEIIYSGGTGATTVKKAVQEITIPRADPTTFFACSWPLFH